MKVVIARWGAFRFNRSVNLRAYWRPFLKRLGIATLILFAASILLLAFERVSGASALKNRINELVQRGELFEIAKLEPVRPAPSEDAVAALVSLTNRLNSATSNLLALLPPVSHFAMPGKAVVSSKLPRWSGWLDKRITNTWASLHAHLTEDSTLPDAVHAALLKPGWNDGHNYHRGFVDFPLGPAAVLRDTTVYLKACALAALNQGNVPVAVDRVEDMLRLVRHQANSSLIISELMRIACAAIGWHTCWEIVVSGHNNETQLAQLQAAWEGLDFSTNMARAMEMERAMTMDQFEQMLSSPGYLERAANQGESPRSFFGVKWPTSGTLLRQVHIPVWRFAWVRQDQLRSLNHWQTIIEFDRQVRAKSWAGLQAETAIMDAQRSWLFDPKKPGPQQQNLGGYDRYRFLFSGMTLGIGRGTTRRALELESQRRLMIVAIALRRYQLRHGSFPERLEELRPDLLAAVPVDLMDGKPLRYRRLPDGSPLLYSVGFDGQDDGGDAHLPEGEKRSLGLWSGKDAVWPAPASAAEAEKAVNE